MNPQDTAAIVRSYYDAWTAREFGRATSLLAADLTTEVPVNHYPDGKSFAAALEGFASMTTRTELLAAMSAGKEGMLLYDMDVRGLARCGSPSTSPSRTARSPGSGRCTTPPRFAPPALSADARIMRPSGGTGR